MPVQEPFAERAIRFTPAERRFSLLAGADGRFLGVGEDGALGRFSAGDDKVIWRAAPGGFEHVATGRRINADGEDGSAQAEGGRFAPVHGPEKLPSEYLRLLRENGWTCLTSILAPQLVDELQRVARTDRYADLEPDRETPQFSQSPALARTAAEPVSLWVVRRYMHTDDVHFSHAPALIVLAQDDGRRNVQGWHSDYPYHWGVPAPGRVPELPTGAPLGVQRNVCVSAFTKVRGATAFKLGSHALGRGPPNDWGTAAAHAKPGYRAERGLPYNGPDADVVEAPPGSIILYDSRTWHRAGVNRTEHKRAAMLQAMTPMFVMPKNDTSRAYRHFLQSPAYSRINAREREELRRLMVHRFLGPAGRDVISANPELSELFDGRR